MNRRVTAWREGGAFESVGGDSIFVQRRDGGGLPLLLLHGFPSSSYDWRETLALLGDRASLALDFLGFGLSAKPRDIVYSLFRQADIVEQLVSSESPPVVLVAHDMGTSVATELLARDLEGKLSFALGGVLLFNGSIIVQRASLTWAQQVLRSPVGPILARLSNRLVFTRQFGRLFSDEHPLSAAEAEDQWTLWSHNGGARIAHRLINYIDERIEYASRWHGAISDWQGDLRLAWGMHDPVATPNVLAGLRELRPSAPITELSDLGHYPQLEQPERIAGLIDRLGA